MIVKKAENKGTKQENRLMSCCVYNLCFYGVWRGFRAISVGFSLVLMPEEYREAKTH